MYVSVQSFCDGLKLSEGQVQNTRDVFRHKTPRQHCCIWHHQPPPPKADTYIECALYIVISMYIYCHFLACSFLSTLNCRDSFALLMSGCFTLRMDKLGLKCLKILWSFSDTQSWHSNGVWFIILCFSVCCAKVLSGSSLDSNITTLKALPQNISKGKGSHSSLKPDQILIMLSFLTDSYQQNFGCKETCLAFVCQTGCSIRTSRQFSSQMCLLSQNTVQNTIQLLIKSCDLLMSFQTLFIHVVTVFPKLLLQIFNERHY